MPHCELIWNFLREFFNCQQYTMAILRARNAISAKSVYKENWLRIAAVIRNRELLPGRPLTLVHEGANQMLDVDSDEEAYVWLDKMVNNVERFDGEIEEY